jgi:hypothetical protein
MGRLRRGSQRLGSGNKRGLVFFATQERGLGLVHRPWPKDLRMSAKKKHIRERLRATVIERDDYRVSRTNRGSRGRTHGGFTFRNDRLDGGLYGDIAPKGWREKLSS